MMAGLACGEPSPMAWDILKGLTSAYVACEDAVAARACALARLSVADRAIISGERRGDDGRAAGGGRRRGGKAALGLDARARVLLISTEGDTDPVNYRGDGEG